MAQSVCLTMYIPIQVVTRQNLRASNQNLAAKNPELKQDQVMLASHPLQVVQPRVLQVWLEPPRLVKQPRSLKNKNRMSSNADDLLLIILVT